MKLLLVAGGVHDTLPRRMLTRRHVWVGGHTDLPSDGALAATAAPLSGGTHHRLPRGMRRALWIVRNAHLAPAEHLRFVRQPNWQAQAGLAPRQGGGFYRKVFVPGGVWPAY